MHTVHALVRHFYREIPPLEYFFRVHIFCTVSLYLTFLTCIFLNFYVLLSRNDTIFYLRMYHVLVGGLMLICIVIMVEFMFRTRRLPKLLEPLEMPTPALIGAVALTIGIVIGYLYFIIFNYSFSNCDKLVDALYGSEFYLDAIYSSMMVIFCATALIYVLQRRYYGSISSHLDKVSRLWVNVTLCIVWMKVVVYKGYLSHHELCTRKELEGYWCPVLKRHYDCSPADDLHGTQKIWYYLNKGLLNTSVISCASEFFPVLLIAHWLACGGAEEKHEDILKRQNLHQGVRSLLREFVKNISRVYADSTAQVFPPLNPSKWIFIAFNVIVPITTAFMIIRWLVFFNYAIEYDEIVKSHRMTNDVIQLIANFTQMIMFLAVFLWSKSVPNDRLDAHHKANARGDVIILFGCCTVLAIKCTLQIVEYSYQRKDGFIYARETVMRIISIVCVHASQWFQYLGIRRLLALSDADIRETRRFLPAISLSGVILAWIHFGVTFFDTSLIKYSLSEEEFKFTGTTLIIMIFTQTIFPADYLYAFTASGCWLETLIRYLEIGFFQIGRPRLSVSESSDGGHGDDHRAHSGSAHGFFHVLVGTRPHRGQSNGNVHKDGNAQHDTDGFILRRKSTTSSSGNEESTTTVDSSNAA